MELPSEENPFAKKATPSASANVITSPPLLTATTKMCVPYIGHGKETM